MTRRPSLAVVAIALALMASACSSDGEEGGRDLDLALPELPGLTQDTTLMREYQQLPKVAAFGKNFGVLTGNTLRIIRAASGEVLAEHEIPAADANIDSMVRADAPNLVVWGEERSPGSALTDEGEDNTIYRIFDESGEKVWEGGGENWAPLGDWLLKVVSQAPQPPDFNSTSFEIHSFDGKRLWRSPSSQAPGQGVDTPIAGSGQRLIVENSQEIYAYSLEQQRKIWSAREANPGAPYLGANPSYVAMFDEKILVEWDSAGGNGALALHSADDGKQVWAINLEGQGGSPSSPQFQRVSHELANDAQSSTLAVYSDASHATRVFSADRGKVSWQSNGAGDRRDIWPLFIVDRYLYGISFSDDEQPDDREASDVPAGNSVAIDTVDNKVAWNDNAIVPGEMTHDGYVWLSTTGSQTQPFAGAIVKVP